MCICTENQFTIFAFESIPSIKYSDETCFFSYSFDRTLYFLVQELSEHSSLRATYHTFGFTQTYICIRLQYTS